jgi:serine/threonine protein phosphatase PrpC
MDELTSWLKAENLSDCAPYLQGLSMLQVISLASLPTALVDEKPKLAKKLKSAIKAYKKSGKKPQSTPKVTSGSSSAITIKPIIVPASSSDPQRASSSAPIREEVEPLPPMPFDHDPTAADFDNLIRLGRETNKRIADAWRVAFEGGHKSVDDEEFLITTDLVSSTLACLSNTPVSSIPDFRLFYSKLRQFCELQQEYESNVIRPDQLKSFQTSRSKRRKVSRLNSRVHMEIKWVLAASGVTNSERESLAIRKRSLGRITVREGQALWETHFLDLDMDMVPWDRFIGAFMMHTKQTIDMHDEILLKHILDNDNLGTVTPKQFSSFLKCFGPLDKALENVKNLYKQKWFHDFLSVEEVHRLLTDQPPGTFLVRFSRSHSNSFALEYVSGKVLTVLIRNDMPNGVYIKEENNVEKMFPNLDSLIKHYSDILKIPFQSDILIQPWFVGDVSTQDAEDMLSSRPPGTFMIRFAATGRFQYACSYSTIHGVKHTMIQKVPNGYVIEETRASPNAASSSSPPAAAADGEGTTSGSANASGSSSASSSAAVQTGGSGTNAWTPASMPTVYPSLQAFLKVWKSELRYNYDADNVPNLPVMEFMETDRYVNLSGPGDSDGHGGDAEFGGRVYAQTVATYPKFCLGWEVVCDQWYVRLLGNRIVFALADGCNWGQKVRLAASTACRAIIDQVGDRDVQARIRDTMEGRHYLLRSFSVAHEQVVAATTGTTTLLAGIIMEVDPDTDEWALVCASVGDCKAFVYVQEADRCVDVTLGNRRDLRNARDPGGRLGDSDGQKQPDLRNLQSYFWPVKRNDILMLVSDGVHDNLDPESFGRHPKDIAAEFSDPRLSSLSSAIKDWDDADQDTTEKLKSSWMLEKLHSIIKSQDMTAKSVSNALVDFVTHTTSPSRDFMEAYPDKQEPSDHVAYPGKMDHTTCIAFTIGPLFKDLVSWRNRAMRGPTASTVSLLASSGGAAAGNAVANGVAVAKKSIVQEDVRSEARKLQQQALASGASSSNTGRSSNNIGGASGGVGSSNGGMSRPLSPSAHSSVNSLTSSSQMISKASSIAGSASTPVLTPLASTPLLFQPEAPAQAASNLLMHPQQSLPATLIASHMSNMFASFPLVTLSPYSSEYALQIGNGSAGDCELSCANLATGRSSSTYPVDTSSLAGQTAMKKRIGDPNTTTFCLEATPTRITFAMSAGTTWGASAADASYKACHSFFHSIREAQPDIENARNAAISCVRAFDKCQQSISEITTDAQSTVVLLAGMLASTPQQGRWVSIFVTLGNNKAFVWKRATQTVVDLTNPKEGADRRQPGGFLSTDPRNNAPMLSNLCVSFGDLAADDIVIVMSPGAYFNFDPELLGLPTDSANVSPTLKESEWSPDLPEHIQAKAHYRCKAIEQVISGLDLTADDLPKRMSVSIIDYCKKTTSSAREYMEANPTASEPRDRAKYPGKMGHAMCLAIRANKLTAQEVVAATTASTRQSLLTTQSRPMKA